VSILLTDYINSRAFFDDQFRIGEWERNNGPAQTRYFMSCIVAALPAAERRHLGSQALSILDWGCALGDGVDVLKQAFPRCVVVGQDFSVEAITRARRAYPQHEFVVDEEIRCDFDVVVVSNCLEHFGDPLRLVETHLASCRALYVALVPFEEEPLYDGHASRFDRDTFPPRLGAWTRIALRPIEMDPRYWLGSQLLVVYGSQSYASDTVGADVPEPGLSAEQHMNEDAAYRAMLAAEGRKWGDHLKVEASGEWNSWLDHPYIAAHYRQRALVDGLSWPAFVRRELGGPAERCLDLGCGAGARSFSVYDEGAALSLEGHDISADRIAQAEQVRLARGIPGGFAVADGNAGELPAGRYGLIFSCHSFHHFLRLEHIMEQVHRALTPSGFFVLEEYVGPTQFQWTDEQIALTRALMALVPERLRRLRWDAIKTFEGRPTPAEVVAVSPFESIRSAEIYPLFQQHFQVVAAKKLGGTLQHLLYNGIVHRFVPSDAEAQACLDAVIGVEDALIDTGRLPSDFMLLIGRRKDAPG
jgi:SAM-dependent methyltransferase